MGNLLSSLVNNVLPEIVVVLVLHVFIKSLIKVMVCVFVNCENFSSETKDFKDSLTTVPTVKFVEFVDKSGFN